MAVSKQRKDHKKKVQQRKEKIVVERKQREKNMQELVRQFNEQREKVPTANFQENFRNNFPNTLNKAK